MSTIDLGDSNVRRLLKEALAEALQEQRDFLKDLLAEVVEDAGLVAAIREGREGDFVAHDDVIASLNEGGSSRFSGPVFCETFARFVTDKFGSRSARYIVRSTGTAG